MGIRHFERATTLCSARYRSRQGGSRKKARWKPQQRGTLSRRGRCWHGSARICSTFPAFVASSGPSSSFLLAWPLPPPIPGRAEGGTLEMACAHTYMGRFNNRQNRGKG
eukprot:948775-Prorocentrum_minimum.AAC.2